jgi:hypothetical protein
VETSALRRGGDELEVGANPARVGEDGRRFEKFALFGLDAGHPNFVAADGADLDTMTDLDAGRRRLTGNQRRDRADPARRVEGPHRVDERGDEGHRARRQRGILTGDVRPDGDGVAHLGGQPGAIEDRLQRSEQERRALPRAFTQERSEAGARDMEHWPELLVGARYLLDEDRVGPSAPGPASLEARGRRVEIGVEPHRRRVPRADLIDLLDLAQGQVLFEVEVERAEGPLEPGAIEQDVRAAIEGEAVVREAGREPARLGATFEERHRDAAPGEPERGAEPAHARTDDDDTALHGQSSGG